MGKTETGAITGEKMKKEEEEKNKNKKKNSDSSDVEGHKNSKGQWVAGEGDDGIDAMTANINRKLGENFSVEDIRNANDMHEANPIIVKGRAYNLPEKK